jgi:DNA mismatch endonuclease Vsr
MKALQTDPATSARMSGIRQAGTSVELLVGAVLRDAGIAYRKNVRSLPGSPDFANKSRRWAIFVNGCYWHHHTACKRATIPKRNADFWIDKFSTNRARDARAIQKLRHDGYRVMIVWECEEKAIERALSQILESCSVDRR